MPNVLKAETSPTPKPAKKRPAKKSGIAVAAVWRITPKVKTRAAAISANRRPRKSAQGAAESEPKKVPADRIETIAAVFEAETSGAPFASRVPSVKSAFQ